VGAGPGALAAEESAIARGAASARGANGAMGSGMMGGGHGVKGGEDEEHQRASFLIEGDPDAIFGTDERTVPPVIGA
jgi:hypothetical protein